MSLSRTVRYLWNGPSSLPRSLQLEWRFVAVRWLGIITISPGLALLHLPLPHLLSAYAIIAVAVVYNLIVQAQVQRRPQLFASGYVTAIGDALLNIAMVNVGAGFNSPFYYILFTVTIAAAMRFGYGPSLYMVALFIGLDALESRPIVHGDVVPSFLFRSGFLLITAVLAGYLREQARRAEGALQRRLRQTSLLNEATAALGASLELDTVLSAVAGAACRLLDGRGAVLHPHDSLSSAMAAQTFVYPPTVEPGLQADLDALCRRADARQLQARASTATITQEPLPSGDEVMVFHLVVPTRQTPLATLAVAAPHLGGKDTLDPDIRESFVERITLAIENASLYRALADRSSDLQRAYGDLATAHQELLGVDEMKTNFLANVSHELRTPLSSIRSFSELLLSYEDDPSVQREFVGIINAESERLTRLVNDVLDITKIEAGKMDWHLTRVDLAALVRDAARTYTGLMAERSLTFCQDIAADLPCVEADRDRLQQVVGNLLTNAIKFTPVGTITLRAWHADGEISIAVTDTGIGIAPDDQGRIFEKFQQVGDTLTDKPHGTGLGLCICRDIVVYHGGRLWVESRLGEGSTFTFTLPAHVEVSTALEPARPAA